MKENILFITYEYGKKIYGGVGRVINALVSSLSGRINIIVLQLQYNFRKYTWSVNLSEISGNRIRRKHYKMRYVDVLLKIMSSRKISLVHIFHHGKQITDCVLAIKTGYPQVKMIYSCHSITKHEINIRKNYVADLEYEEYTLNNAGHIQVLNRTSLDILKQTYSAVACKKSVSIIPNGIDESAFKRRGYFFRKRLIKETSKEENIIITSLTRWSHGKGLEYLLDAVPLVTCHERHVKFVLAGRKKLSWEHKLDEYLAKIDNKLKTVKNHVKTYGWLNDMRRNALCSITDIWVMPSQLEYFPYSILEPMVCRIPIISSRINCTVELLEENKDCLFYNPGEPEDLAEKLLILISSKEKREMLAENAYKKVTQMYQWSKIAQKYLDMYQSVIRDSCVKETEKSVI